MSYGSVERGLIKWVLVQLACHSLESILGAVLRDEMIAWKKVDSVERAGGCWCN